MKIEIIRASSKSFFTPFGWIIKKNQKVSWSHYAISYTNDDGEVFISDAKRKGIRKVYFHEFNEHYNVEKQTIIDVPCKFDEFNTYVESMLGKRYPFWQLIGIGLISWGIIKSNPFGKDRNYLVCHEYVLVMLQRFFKITLSDTDDYTFRKAEDVIQKVKSL